MLALAKNFCQLISNNSILRWPLITDCIGSPMPRLASAISYQYCIGINCLQLLELTNIPGLSQPHLSIDNLKILICTITSQHHSVKKDLRYVSRCELEVGTSARGVNILIANALYACGCNKLADKYSGTSGLLIKIS